MTLAAKHKKRVKWVLARYCRKSAHGLKALIVEVDNPNHPDKPYRAMLGGLPIRANHNVKITDRIPQFGQRGNELIQRLLANACELCSSPDRVSVHHIRKLADIKKKYRGWKDPPPWVRFMMERNRKTVVVCHRCHNDIHAGRYDGQKVSQD
ncbi:hypothetical protein KFU94_09925 [Chloroflexi bacterium TSY]|nr:hypothetical protein [Chloroflexi bacterium TSY]